MTQPVVLAFDMDRTLALPNDAKELHSYKPFLPLVNLAKFVQKTPEMVFLVTTARGENLRGATESWLREYQLFPQEVLMRGSGDTRKDSEVRVSQIIKVREKYGSSVFLYDDKLANCQAVENQTGTPCVLVNTSR